MPPERLLAAPIWPYVLRREDAACTEPAPAEVTVRQCTVRGTCAS